MEVVGPNKKVEDVKSILKQAEAEVAEELAKANKEKLKKKLKEIESAKLIVRNLEREIEDLMTEMAD